MTFGVVHAALLTLIGLSLAVLVPSFNHFLFSLYGCVLAPLSSFLLCAFCNACLEYCARSSVTVQSVLSTAWIPSVGVFCVSLLILPLEMMPSLGFHGPINTLVATSVVLNFFVAGILQVYAARRLQGGSSYSSPSEEELSSDSAASSCAPTKI